MADIDVRLLTKLVLVAALAAGSLPGCQAAGAARVSLSGNPAQPQPAKCPAPGELDAALAQASEWLGQSRFQDVAGMLQPLAAENCDPRISLLLAAGFEGQGDLPKAAAELERAHRLWPANDSIAASLAREYIAAGDTENAAKALAHFHVTERTPEQEMRMAVVVYLAAHRLPLAESVAAAAYKTYPSVQTLLLLANTLQMQGRYPDVNRLLGSQRASYAGSPEFFVTLAESEFDASIYPRARDDLQRALALDPGLYQAHYVMGNVLSKLNDGDGAEAEYRKAIALAPNQPRTYFQLALLLRTKQDEHGEQQALTQALAVDEHYGPAQCEMGRILLEQEHRPADAVSHLATAIKDNPRFEQAYFLLARAYAQLGEQDKSQEIVRRLTAVRKENRPAQGGAMKDFPDDERAPQP
ncbi:MAG TPA: tetratricopeptide repeat protein [Acidobacteriaceae bacterium]|jgi:tetratricopeptide (TPR) repeat protein|nr:tetratricopeptide repeat protein [Acidobacteriaceae bacterium]